MSGRSSIAIAIALTVAAGSVASGGGLEPPGAATEATGSGGLDFDSVELPPGSVTPAASDRQDRSKISFAALEGSLKPARVTAVAKSVGAKLSDQDRLPTFYFAIKGGKRFAVAEYVSIQTEAGLTTLAVAMDTGGTVSGIKILKNPASKPIEDAAFLAQFRGKKRGAMEIGKDFTAAGKEDDLSSQVALVVAQGRRDDQPTVRKVKGARS